MTNTLTIPVQLIDLALKQSIQPEFKVFLGAKMVSPDYFNAKSAEFNNLCTLVGFQRRTVLKHLDHLVKLNWVGFDKRVKRYYIRSWTYFRSKELFYERASVSFQESEMTNFRVFVAGVIIGYKIKKQEYAFKQLANETDSYKLKINKKIRKSSRGKASKSVTNNRSVTPQDSDPHPAVSNQVPGYNGFSNARIAGLLYCKYTNACNLKHDAEKAGYLIAIPRLKIIRTLPAPDYSIRHLYNRIYGDDARKLRFSTEFVDGVKTCCLVEQLHDEIIPLIPFRRVRYLKMLHKKKLKEHKHC